MRFRKGFEGFPYSLKTSFRWDVFPLFFRGVRPSAVVVYKIDRRGRGGGLGSKNRILGWTLLPSIQNYMCLEEEKKTWHRIRNFELPRSFRNYKHILLGVEQIVRYPLNFKKTFSILMRQISRIYFFKVRSSLQGFKLLRREIFIPKQHF